MPDIMTPVTRGVVRDFRQVQGMDGEALELRRLFYTKDQGKKPRVDEFLEEHPGLIDLLSLVGTKLLTYFPDLTAYLEVRDDPETNETYLNVSIARNGRSLNKAFLLLQEFQDSWWVFYNGPDRLLLNITLEHGR